MGGGGKPLQDEGAAIAAHDVGALALLIPLGIAIANQIGIDPRVAATTVHTM